MRIGESSDESVRVSSVVTLKESGAREGGDMGIDGPFSDGDKFKINIRWRGRYIRFSVDKSR